MVEQIEKIWIVIHGALVTVDNNNLVQSLGYTRAVWRVLTDYYTHIMYWMTDWHCMQCVIVLQ